MTTEVYCKKLNKRLEALEEPPIPGKLGEKIHQHISKKAWALWLAHQTMLINEYRLNMMDKSARDFLQKEMHTFLFSNAAEKPPGFKDIPKE